MCDVIQFPFPRKEKFIEKYAANLPGDLKECLSIAYDEIFEKSQNLPSVEIKVSKEQIEKINNFKNQYNSIVIELLSELLKAKAEICMLKAGL